MAEKRKSIDLKTKLGIIAEVKKGRSYDDIKNQFKISKSSISGIYKNWEKYEGSDASSNVKRFPSPKFPEVELACIERLKVVRARNLPESGSALMEKAKQFADQLGRIKAVL